MNKVITGSKTAIKLTLQPLSSAIAATAAAAVATPCAPAISGLFWFSDSTGQFDQTAEAAYLATPTASPVLGVAALLGEGCELPVTWTTNWVPDTGTGGDPGVVEDGQRLVVFQTATSVPGVLTVTAEHNGQSYGPIALSLFAAAAGGTCTVVDIAPMLTMLGAYVYAYMSYTVGGEYSTAFLSGSDFEIDPGGKFPQAGGFGLINNAWIASTTYTGNPIQAYGLLYRPGVGGNPAIQSPITLTCRYEGSALTGTLTRAVVCYQKEAGSPISVTTASQFWHQLANIQVLTLDVPEDRPFAIVMGGDASVTKPVVMSALAVTA